MKSIIIYSWGNALVPIKSVSNPVHKQNHKTKCFYYLRRSYIVYIIS